MDRPERSAVQGFDRAPIGTVQRRGSGGWRCQKDGHALFWHRVGTVPRLTETLIQEARLDAAVKGMFDLDQAKRGFTAA